MAAGSAAAAGGAGGAAPVAGGNPFQLATNLYAEKNNVGALTSFTVVAGAQSATQGGQVNAGQYLRRVPGRSRRVPPSRTCRGTSSRASTW